MNLFELFVKIGVDDKASPAMKNAQKNSEALANKIKVMSARFDSAQKNVDNLTKKFNESVKKTGATSKETQELAKKLDSAEKAEQATKALDGYNDELDDTSAKTKKSINELSNFSGKIGRGFATSAKIGVAALAAAAAGVTALTTSAVNSYAEYEQLVGGVDTLFKDASKKLQQYASEAYRTSGMSANEYMANATAFSASLISSLGGDTEKAAEYANRAMVSMSDNANKMGTSLDSIVQTYQSLSRGNMAMLDNLKLGYGGSKAELERLIADAASYTDIQKEMGITVDKSSMSFDNIVNAIAVVQGKLGIAGATAAEAGTTIEGSVNSMKAAWQNLIAGLANGNADIGQLIDNLVTSIVGDGTEGNLGVIGNILPATERAIGGTIRLIEGISEKIIDILPGLAEKIVPALVGAAIGLVNSVNSVLPGMVDMVVNTMLPQLIDGALSVTESLIRALPSAISSIAGALPSLAKQFLLGAVNLIVILAENLPSAIRPIIAILPELLKTISQSLLENADVLLGAFAELAVALIPMIPEILNILLDSAIITFTEQWAKAIVEMTPVFLVGAAKIVYALARALPGLLVAAIKAIFQPFATLFVGIKSIFNALPSWFKNLVFDIGDYIKNGFAKILDGAKTWGSDMIDNFVNGIKQRAEKLKDSVVGVAQTIRDFIGFSEPKKGPLSNFHTYAPDMMDLFAKGIRDNEDIVANEIKRSFDFGEIAVGTGSNSIGSSFGGNTFGDIHIHVNGGNYDENALAEALAVKLQGLTDRRAAVYA